MVRRKLRALSFEEKLEKRRLSKRGTRRWMQEKSLLKGIRSHDRRVFAYDEVDIHCPEDQHREAEVWWVENHYVDQDLINEQDDQKIAKLLTGSSEPLPWDDVDSSDYDPEGKPVWQMTEDEHAERTWRAVERWTEKARHESWPTDQGDIS